MDKNKCVCSSGGRSYSVRYTFSLANITFTTVGEIFDALSFEIGVLVKDEGDCRIYRHKVLRAPSKNGVTFQVVFQSRQSIFPDDQKESCIEDAIENVFDVIEGVLREHDVPPVAGEATESATGGQRQTQQGQQRNRGGGN